MVRYLRGVMEREGLAEPERLRDEEQERMLDDVRALVEREQLEQQLEQQQQQQPAGEEKAPLPLAERLARLVVDSHSGATLLHLAAAKGYERLFGYTFRRAL